MLSRANIRSAADLIAILTALSFVMSALLQEGLFALWGLDFTAIASIEDVILGGVRVLSFLLLGAFFATLLFVWDSVMTDEEVIPSDKVSKLVRDLLMFALLGFLIFAAYFISGPAWSSGPVTVAVCVVGMIAFFVIVSIALACTLSPLPLGETVHRLRRVKAPRMRFPVIIWAMYGMIVSIIPFVSPYTRLGVRGEAIPTQCGDPKDPHFNVKWIGSRAIVLKCGGSHVVVFPGEQPYTLLVTSSRPRP
jgi:hypothetical protein